MNAWFKWWAEDVPHAWGFLSADDFVVFVQGTYIACKRCGKNVAHSVNAWNEMHFSGAPVSAERAPQRRAEWNQQQQLTTLQPEGGHTRCRCGASVFTGVWNERQMILLLRSLPKNVPLAILLLMSAKSEGVSMVLTCYGSQGMA